jgi:hypothetical protein
LPKSQRRTPAGYVAGQRVRKIDEELLAAKSRDGLACATSRRFEVILNHSRLRFENKYRLACCNAD